MRHIYLVILICCLYSCESKPPPRPLSDLLGHWHLSYRTVFQNDTFKREVPVDLYIVDHNLSQYKWPYRQTSETGIIDRVKLKIRFYDDFDAYDWSWKNDSTVQLFLNKPDTDQKRMTLHRRKNDFEHQRGDYFRDHPATLLLPSTSATPRLLPEIALVSHIYLKEITPDSVLYQLGDKTRSYIDEDILGIFDEQHRVKLPSSKQNNVVKAIFTDATTPLSRLQTLASHYQTQRFDTLLFAVNTAPTSDSFQVHFRSVAVSSLLGGDGILQDIIE